MQAQLEIRHLKLIKAIAETGTVSRASEKLFLTQSALSHQLRDMEQKLDAPLFLRLKKKMILTPAGERLLDSAKKLLAELETAERDVRQFNSENGGVLRLATDCYTCYHWLPPLLGDFQKQFPNVRVQIVAEATRNAVAALLAGEIDAAITDSAISEPELLVSDLFEDELVAVCSPKHRFAKKAFLRAEDFADEHLFTYKAPLKDLSIIRDFLAPRGVEPKQHSQIELTEAIIEMVKADLGIAVLANWAARPHLEAGTLVAVRITKKGLPRRWSAVIRKNHGNQPSPKYLRDFAAMIAKQRFEI